MRSKEELDRVMSGLNLRGIREKHLMDALKEDYDNLNHCFAVNAFSFNLEAVPRGCPCFELEPFYKANKKYGRTPVDKLKQEHISCALKVRIQSISI